MKTILRSYHFWMWVIYIAAVLFCRLYPRIHIYEDRIDEIFAPLEWVFILTMFSAFWFLIYGMFILDEP